MGHSAGGRRLPGIRVDAGAPATPRGAPREPATGYRGASRKRPGPSSGRCGSAAPGRAAAAHWAGRGGEGKLLLLQAPESHSRDGGVRDAGASSPAAVGAGRKGGAVATTSITTTITCPEVSERLGLRRRSPPPLPNRDRAAGRGRGGGRRRLPPPAAPPALAPPPQHRSLPGRRLKRRLRPLGRPWVTAGARLNGPAGPRLGVTPA